ncbi:MAG: hypothetical protein Tsb0027_23140 [Wenzhouxiangellaceae bacterium]
MNEYVYWSRAVKANELEKTLLYASHDSEPVMVSLKNNNIYVGYVTMIADTIQQNDRDWVELLIILSGYRDHESRVHYTLNYNVIARTVLFSNASEHRDNNEQNKSQAAKDDRDDRDETDKAYQNFMIALPVSEIISVHRYDEQIALMAQQAQDTAQTETPDDRHHH